MTTADMLIVKRQVLIAKIKSLSPKQDEIEKQNTSENTKNGQEIPSVPVIISPE